MSEEQDKLEKVAELASTLAGEVERLHGALDTLEERVAACERILLRVIGGSRASGQVGAKPGVTARGSQRCGKCGKVIDGRPFECAEDGCPIDPKIARRSK